MCAEIILYSTPILPLFSRAVLCLWHHEQMKEILTEAELDQEAHRSHILVLAGFSFTGLLAISVLDATLRKDFHFAVFYLLVSFLCYFFALNLQSYKARRWHDQFATAIMDSASLSLILAIVSILYLPAFNPNFSLGSSTLALFVWVTDHVIRLKIQWTYLSIRKGGKEHDRQKTQGTA